MHIPASLRDSGCLYLHGFLSSPASEKAQQVMQFFRDHPQLGSLSAPFLHFAPAEAIDIARNELTRLQNKHEHVWIIGSSLGGFYATWLAEQAGVPAALINPAVRPGELFRHYLGEHTHYHTGETFLLESWHLEQLTTLTCDTIKAPEKLLLLLQTGDETLDYRHAAELYRHSPGWLEGGGTHSFDHFIERMPQILGHVSRNL
ncbi:YqiA/YcfP family alpha/beta fold hydrolase [uncultured Thalassolituus sp.]|uniref:YqiA/YcfP family alpha/beta fold hydrolase n=1 Tax=uncultured Thalassolituus sp. TaxID=285273 RepID=UPI0026344F69|nr:YqiA/YcfP family alpha/beta fold hydrolase [uncultured Thalassolituus sp.]